MSKTIEFVEKEIKNIKELYELDDVLCLRTDEDYKFWYNRLQILEQIKCVLEAWEVVKENVNVYGHEYNKELIEYVQITEEQLPDEKHINIIKKAKALEVENDSTIKNK